MWEYDEKVYIIGIINRNSNSWNINQYFAAKSAKGQRRRQESDLHV